MTDTLLTRYRPTTFDAVIGQTTTTHSLKTALDRNSNRTFLFTGGPGLGKTTLARIAAKHVGCKPTGIIEVDGATHGGVDAMRDVAATFEYPPMNGKASAIIVDEAHAISKQAWQSLLKVLEEPPSFGYWFLCTTELAKVPVAIKSRCHHLELKPVTPSVMAPWLVEIARKEKTDWRGGAFEKIAQLCAEKAEGSPRQALAYLSVVLGATDVGEARELLKSAEDEESGPIELARALAKGTNWRALQPILRGLQDTPPETVRQVVFAYFTKVALSAGGPPCDEALAILDAFEQPFNPMDRMVPLVLACARLTHRK